MRIKSNYTLLLITLILLGDIQLSFAKNYYVDDIKGNDSNSGLTQIDAWKTLIKVNSVTFTTGDSVLFKRSGVWRGQLLPQSGTASGNIIYSS